MVEGVHSRPHHDKPRVDEPLLRAHRKFEDLEAGIAEEFMDVPLRSGATLGVLTSPLAERSPVGWVVCHSLGIEQINMARLDVRLARGLAAAGFPVVRVHGRGYGDGPTAPDGVALASHLEDAEDAIEFMADQPGIEAVGVLGARFGGTVAAILAEAREVPLLALWQPAVRGEQYLRELLRTEVLFRLAREGEVGGRSREDLTTKGWANVKGFRLTRETYDAIAAIDLTKDMRRFRHSVLVGSVSRAGNVPVPEQELVARLETLGARCATAVIQHPRARRFGYYPYSRELDRRRDELFDLTMEIVGTTVAWARKNVEPLEGAGRRRIP